MWLKEVLALYCANILKDNVWWALTLSSGVRSHGLNTGVQTSRGLMRFAADSGLVVVGLVLLVCCSVGRLLSVWIVG